MKALTRIAMTVTFLLPAGLVQAMGPNPGGKLGEDMPFQGDDVVRRAPAATAERQPPPASQATACAPQDGKAGSPAATAQQSGCPGTAKEAEPKRPEPPSAK